MTVASAAMTLDRVQLGWRGQMVTVVLSAWALLGAFLDGWAHSKVDQIETFFTPQHNVFYSGFLAMAIWVVWCVVGQRRAGRSARAAVPIGYDLALIGLVVFGAGTVFDFLWHEVFGVEQAGERLSSPAHLALFVGGILVITAPFRAAWAAAGTERPAPSLVEFLPALLSLTLATTATSFFFLHVWGFNSADFLGARQLGLLLQPVAGLPETTRTLLALTQIRVFASIVITTLLLLGPVLLMLRQWRIPFGSITILLTTTAVWMSGLTEFHVPEVIGVVALAGLLADGLAALLQPAVDRPAAFRGFAAAVPVILWSLYFIVTDWRWHLAVSPELWGGGLFFTAIAGFALSLVMVPDDARARVARDL